MYLTYNEYLQMGGTLDNATFNLAERKARYLINAQAGGQTGERIGKLAELPQTVKDCTFDLVSFLAVCSADKRQISSESQSQGGASESVSYVTKTDEQITAECESIIYNDFHGGGVGNLLCRGAAYER